MSRFLTIIFVLFFICSLSAAEPVFLSFVRPESSERTRTFHIASTMRRQVNALFVSGQKSSVTFEFSIPPPDGEGKFGFKRVRNGHYEITFPPRTTDWTGNAGSRNMLIKYMTAARLGLRMERAVLLPDSWIFAALSVPHTDNIMNPQRALQFPGAYAMISRGYNIRLQQILAYPGSPGDGAVYQLFEEWSRILFELCRRDGLIQRGAAEAFLRRLAARPETDQNALFTEFFVSGLAVKHSAADVSQFDPQRWFSEGCGHFMISAFSPFAPEIIEQKVLGSLSEPQELFQKKKPLSSEDKLVISKAILELTRFSRIVPLDLSEPLRRMLMPLEILRDVGVSEKNTALYRARLRDLLRAIALRSELCRMLRSAEMRLVFPGARRFMPELVIPPSNIPKMLSAASAMLDKYERSPE